MKRERSGVMLLLGALLLFSIGIGMLYGDKPQPQNNVETDVAVMPLRAQLSDLAPLIESQSIEKFVEALHDLPLNNVVELIQELINNHNKLEFSADDIIQVIYGALGNVAGDSAAQSQLLELLLKNKELHVAAPLIYIAADSSYPQVIPLLMQWSAGHAQEYPVLLKDVVQRSLEHAVDKDYVEVVQEMLRNGVPVSPQLATQLLWRVINNNRSVQLAQIFANAGADVNSQHNKKTPLIAATMANNIPMVQFLVERAHADVNLIPDVAVGSALQQAFARSHTTIELYLRKHGARE